MTNANLEDMVAEVARSQDAAGVLMLIVTKNQRAEVIAAVTEHLDSDLPGMIERLVKEVRAGGGVPTGRHLQQVPGNDPRQNEQCPEPWREGCRIAATNAFLELMTQAGNKGIWFTQAQQNVTEVACLVAASQAMRILANSPQCEEMLKTIREDSQASGKGKE
jgi:hypothetical protein